MNTVERKVRSLFTLLWYPFYEEGMPCASSEIDNISCQNEISTSVTDSSKARASHVNTCHIRMSSWLFHFLIVTLNCAEIRSRCNPLVEKEKKSKRQYRGRSYCEMKRAVHRFSVGSVDSREGVCQEVRKEEQFWNIWPCSNYIVSYWIGPERIGSSESLL